MSWQAKLVNLILKSLRFLLPKNHLYLSLTRTFFYWYGSIQNLFAPKVTTASWQCDHLTGEWIKINDEPNIILYLHGGAFIMGSAQSYRSLIYSLAQKTRWNILAIDYRLAPEYRYPAALEDVITAYQWLIESDIGTKKIILMGDSAGGNAVISSMLMMKEKKLPLPLAAVCFSPWVDLTHRAHTGYPNSDPILNANLIQQAANLYIGDEDPFNPFISPLYGDISQLPPLFIHVSDIEALYQQAIQLKEKVEKNNVPVELHIGKNLMHAWPFIFWLPESQEVMQQVASWIRNLAESRSSVSK